MAMSNGLSDMNTIRELVRTGLLQCRICNKQLKEPKMLPCLHTFCKACIKKILNNGNSNFLKENGVTSNSLLQNAQKLKNHDAACPICYTTIACNSDDLLTNHFYANLLHILDCQSDAKKVCEYCRFEHKEREANMRCLECQDNMCEECGQAHRKTKITRTHNLVTFKEIRKGKYDNDLRSFQEIQCPQHNDQSLQIFCPQCEVLICDTCRSESHDDHQCVGLKEADQQCKDRVTTILDSVQSKVPVVDVYLDILQMYKKQLTEQKETALAQIEEHVKMLHDMIEKHKSDTVSEITSKHTEETKMIEANELKTKNYKSTLESHTCYMSNLLRFGKTDEVLHVLKNLSHKMTEVAVSQTETLSVKTGIMFNPGNSSSKNTQILFGNTDFPVVPMDETDFSKAVNIEMLSIAPATTMSALPSIGSVSKLMEFEIKGSHDLKDMWPTGIVVTSTDEFVVVDRDNKRIKYFDKSGNFLREFGGSGKTILGCPYDIALLPYDKIAVTDHDKEDVKVFSSSGECVLQIKQGFKHPRGIAVNSKGEIIVVDCGLRRLTIHNPNDGKILRVIEGKDDEGNDYFTDPYYVSVTPNDFIIVTDWAAPNIKVLNSDGKLVAKYGTYGIREDQILQPYGVCTDSSGYIFVADNQNHRIHLLSPNGKFQQFLLSKLDGLWHPMALAINNKGQLVVTEGLGKVKVFSYR